MKINKISMLFNFLLISAFFFFNFGYCCSQEISSDETKIKPDPKIYEEFKNYCEICSNNVFYKGVSSYGISGAMVTARFSVTSKNIEDQKMSFNILNDIYDVTVSSDKVKINQKNGPNKEYQDKKNMSKYNLKIVLDELNDNGKITKVVKDGKYVYTMTLFNMDAVHKYVVDPKTGYFESSSSKYNSGEGSLSGNFNGDCDVTYNGWKKI